MCKRIIGLLLCLAFLLAGCSRETEITSNEIGGGPEQSPTGTKTQEPTSAALSQESLEALGAYEGYFEDEKAEVEITCVSGTPGAYQVAGNTVTFTGITEDSEYAISGKLKGNIVINMPESHKFDLELDGFCLVSDSTNPILITGGDEVAIQAKKDSENYIYDMRQALDPEDDSLYSGAIHSTVDLEIGGKGSMTLVSENNNGIHSKDDLQVKNLTLLVACIDNALKGNDSVEISGAQLTLIASGGDGIKTSNSDVSSKGNQRGTVSLSGGSCIIYAACDGIDAAYDVVVENASTKLDVFTDKYSAYSGEVTANSSEGFYIRFTTDEYKYSIKYYNSDTDYLWVDPQYHSRVNGSRSSYYYYSFPKNDAYSKLQMYIYSQDMAQSQETEYLAATDYMSCNDAYDTLALTAWGGQLSYSWTNYTTKIQEEGFGGRGPGGRGGPGGMGGFGGMGEGNTDKSEYSTKGIKADNAIRILAGSVNIKAYDDAIHANGGETLENGETGLGNIAVSGGSVTVYSNDDGIHADGTLLISAGKVSVTNSYEGLEGTNVTVSGGEVSVLASDDGINSTATSGNGVIVSGGSVYVHCSGDGIDANSRSAYEGILFSGGYTVVISNSGGNSAIDTEQGYTVTGGRVVAIMPRDGMAREAAHCQNFNAIGTYTQLSLTAGCYLNAAIAGNIATVRIPADISAYVILLGDAKAQVTQSNVTDQPVNEYGIYWQTGDSTET